MANILDVTGLSVTLDGEAILEDVSFSLRAGEMTAIIGPNGGGKTTLLKALLGLVPHTGRIQWRPGATVGYVPQRFAVPAGTPVTVLEFLLLKAPRFWCPPGDFVASVRPYLQEVGIDPGILPRPVSSLSAGQLQRLLFAWALAREPEVLLFDEPTASIDVGFTETINAIIGRVMADKGAGVLLISHDLSVVSRLAAQVLCINRGLMCQGPPAAVLTEAQIKRLFGDVALYRHHHTAGHRP